MWEERRVAGDYKDEWAVVKKKVRRESRSRREGMCDKGAGEMTVGFFSVWD